MALQQFLASNLSLVVFFSVLITFLVANKIYPSLIWTLRHINLMDEPDIRSAHRKVTPTMGGVGIYISFSFTLIIMASIMGLENRDLIAILAVLGAAMILVFLGIKDDLVAVGPKKKMMGQIVAAAIVVLLTDIRIFSFEGIFGIGELPFIVSILFSIFVIVAIINAFNLIDGVDGLAGAIALVASVSFGVFFFLNGNAVNVLISSVLIGAIIGFLRYNLSDSNKIFMGDTGSMLVGFLLSVQGLAFLELNALETAQFSVSNGPIMAMAVLSYPILDTLRVFIIRIRDGRSPLSPDRNHIHHRCLGMGLNHKQTTMLLALVNIMIIEIAFLSNDLFINVQLFIILVAVTLAFEVPFIKIREWLSNVLISKHKDAPSKIIDHSKELDLTYLPKIYNTDLGGNSEATDQQPENKEPAAVPLEATEVTDVHKISAKRVATLQKTKNQKQIKKTAEKSGKL